MWQSSRKIFKQKLDKSVRLHSLKLAHKNTIGVTTQFHMHTGIKHIGFREGASWDSLTAFAALLPVHWARIIASGTVHSLRWRSVFTGWWSAWLGRGPVEIWLWLWQLCVALQYGCMLKLSGFFLVFSSKQYNMMMIHICMYKTNCRALISTVKQNVKCVQWQYLLSELVQRNIIFKKRYH